ncbi:Scr1 family TA system antitoxin-like transcriptional regulator [Streptomyces platensis]|uniref:Scr1 family TA system antitoxin-like transcriptional regulator n=1 Tax=Streptomyces platensis TaxID=58346 RepID=UPI0037B93B3E
MSRWAVPGLQRPNSTSGARQPLFASRSFSSQLEAGTRRTQMNFAVKRDEILSKVRISSTIQQFRCCEWCWTRPYLRRNTGGPAVLAEALWHVAEMVRKHRVIVQVLPFSAGAHASMNGALKLMSFEDTPRSPISKC